MASVTQKIPRFTGGISDQPDEQKIPGQVRDAVNCIPDVVQGLVKRPGFNLVRELDCDEGGKWFFIDKSNNFNNFDRYVGRIDNKTGKVKVWDLDNGKEMDICYADSIDPLDLEPSAVGFSLAPSDYTAAYDCEGEEGIDPSEDYFTLESPNIDDLQTLTINDYTFVVNRKVPVQMTANLEEKRKPEATVELRTIAGQQEYKLELFQPGETTNPVTLLSVNSTGYDTTAPACSSAGEEPFTDESSGTDKTGLSFTIKTSSIVVPTEQEDGTTVDQCVYTTKVTLQAGGDGWQVGDTITKVINGVTHVVKVEAIGESVERVKIGEATFTTPAQDPKADVLLDDLKSDIEALTDPDDANVNAGFTVEVIGTSLYITREEAFTVTTPNSILIRPLSATPINDDKDSFVVQANDVADVPLQTKHNLVFQVRNSFSDADDYYLQFKGDNAQDGTGTYVEVPKPGIEHAFEPHSMPHGLLRLSQTRKDADGDIIVTFLVTGFKWAARGAGDDVTNPRPSFAPEAGATFGRPINNIAFFRNRFVALTDENVVLSTAGDFFNFWAKTALSISPSDPIDLQVSNNFPAVLYGAIATTSGLILFSENAQFLLGTENDTLEPRTARTTLLSTYNYNRNSNPVNLGITVGFVSGIGRYTRFYEMASISRDQEPEVVEQTKVVERLVPGDYYDIGISKDNQLVALGKRDFNTVWMFRYFNTGERRAQSAWTRFVFNGNLVSHALINDSYFAVLNKDDKVFLTRGDVRALEKTVMLDDDNGEEYRTFLDYAVAVETTNDSKKIVLSSNDIGLPIFSDSLDKIVSVVYDPDDEQGYITPVEVVPVYSPDNPSVITRYDLIIKTTIENPKVFIGYNFKMSIDLPKFFIKQEANGSAQSWDTANLIIQRVKLNLGRIGYYTTELKRLGRPDYVQVYEAKPMDDYDANDLGYLADYEQTTPVYQRNTTFRMIVHSESPAPAVLYSATWEGQYQENYVKRL